MTCSAVTAIPRKSDVVEVAGRASPNRKTRCQVLSGVNSVNHYFEVNGLRGALVGRPARAVGHCGVVAPDTILRIIPAAVMLQLIVTLVALRQIDDNPPRRQRPGHCKQREDIVAGIPVDKLLRCARVEFRIEISLDTDAVGSGCVGGERPGKAVGGNSIHIVRLQRRLQ